MQDKSNRVLKLKQQTLQLLSTIFELCTDRSTVVGATDKLLTLIAHLAPTAAYFAKVVGDSFRTSRYGFTLCLSTHHIYDRDIYLLYFVGAKAQIPPQMNILPLLCQPFRKASAALVVVPPVVLLATCSSSWEVTAVPSTCLASK